MYIYRLELENFRNFGSLGLDFPAGGALIHGKNGSGKTNLLEAISFFSTGKSFFSNKDQELIRFNHKHTRLLADFMLQDRQLNFQAGIESNRKKIRLNGSYISRTSELYQYLKIIYFSPSDVEFVSGSPALRRNFLDQAISQYSYDYVDLIRKYLRVLKQRNNLLKTGFSTEIKSSWDRQFIELAVRIIEIRLEYLKGFIPPLKDHYQEISSNSENLDLSYEFSFDPAQSDDLETALSSYLQSREKDEIHYQHTLAGPHLDDLNFSLDGHPARRFASQGQKRSIAIAARLVQSEMITRKSRTAPILMFDDVLADLDRDRATAIVKLLQSRHQIFIATPNEKIYGGFELENIDLEKVI